MTITARIIATVPRTGCRVRTLRCVLHDIEAAPLDYAIQGLIRAGKYRLMDDGYIRPTLVAQPAAPRDARGLLDQLFASQKVRG